MPLTDEEKKERKRIANKKYQEKLKNDRSSVESESVQSKKNIKPYVPPKTFEPVKQIVQTPESVNLEPIEMEQIADRNIVEIERDVFDELLRVYQKFGTGEQDVEQTNEKPAQSNQPDFFFSIQQNLISTAIGMLPLVAMKLMAPAQNGTTSSVDYMTNTSAKSEDTPSQSQQPAYVPMKQQHMRQVNFA